MEYIIGQICTFISVKNVYKEIQMKWSKYILLDIVDKWMSAYNHNSITQLFGVIYTSVKQWQLHEECIVIIPKC